MPSYTPTKSTGSGTKAYASADGTTYSLFASVSKLGPPELTRNTVDVTDLNSYEDNDQMKENVVDFIEPGDLTIEGFYKSADAGKALVETAFWNGSVIYIKIVLPSMFSTGRVYACRVTGFREIGEISSDAGIPFSATFKILQRPTTVSTTTTT